MKLPKQWALICIIFPIPEFDCARDITKRQANNLLAYRDFEAVGKCWQTLSKIRRVEIWTPDLSLTKPRVNYMAIS